MWLLCLVVNNDLYEFMYLLIRKVIFSFPFRQSKKPPVESKYQKICIYLAHTDMKTQENKLHVEQLTNASDNVRKFSSIAEDCRRFSLKTKMT